MASLSAIGGVGAVESQALPKVSSGVRHPMERTAVAEDQGTAALKLLQATLKSDPTLGRDLDVQA